MRSLIPFSHDTVKAYVSSDSGQYCYFIVILQLTTRERKIKHLAKNSKSCSLDRIHHLGRVRHVTVT